MTLLQEIANCDNIKTSQQNAAHPCHAIVSSQLKSQGTKNPFKLFQLPEPWNGDLENCKILFISSNPSINTNERYPLMNWGFELIEDFFTNRFSPDRRWVRNQLYPLHGKGHYAKSWVRFWASVRKIARVLLDTNAVQPGKDYAITEIVHCKSEGEHGVKKALPICVERFFERILNLTSAKVIVCLGDKVAGVVREKYNLRTAVVCRGPNTDQYFVFLPHPNARKKRKIEDIVPSAQLKLLKRILK